MAFVRSVHDLYFPGGDALGHIHIARLMLGQPGGTYTLWRTPGMAIFHYVPLHDSPAGSKYGRAHGGVRVTEELSQRIVRLPLWVGLTASDVDRVVSSVEDLAKEAATRSN